MPYILCHFYLDFLLIVFFLCFSETNCLDTGLLIEVWNKGLIWDKAMVSYFLFIRAIKVTSLNVI